MKTDGWRTPAFAAVAACFFIQGALVWGDVGRNPGSTTRLETPARQGQAIFRRNGCQSCHQLFGMGGFLGPDLTNAARRVPAGRFTEVLQYGTPIMPAFHLDSAQRAAVFAYLLAVDANGRGTPPGPRGESGALFDSALTRWTSHGGTIPPEVRAGSALVARKQCGVCHRSFAGEGVNAAPDLSLSIKGLGVEGVRRVITRGRGAMVPSLLTPAESDTVVALLTWVGSRRDELAPASPLPIAAVTWYAYPRQRAESERLTQRGAYR